MEVHTKHNLFNSLYLICFYGTETSGKLVISHKNRKKYLGSWPLHKFPYLIQVTDQNILGVGEARTLEEP
jgi:hypothetical protein